jgi:hypothetical protein
MLIIFDSNIKVIMVKKFLAFSIFVVSILFAQKNNDQQSICQSVRKTQISNDQW